MKCYGCQPDSGNPTVRDERGATRNVMMTITGKPPAKELETEVIEIMRALVFYPDY